jgi:heme exporter protein B
VTVRAAEPGAAPAGARAPEARAPEPQARRGRASGTLGVALAILVKDLRAEWRSREMLTSMLLFALLIVVLFHFAFESDREGMRRIAPGMLWMAFAFAGVLGLNRSFAVEKERGSLAGLLLAPVDRSAIYLGKFLSNLCFLGIVEIVTFPVFSLLLDVPLRGAIPEVALVALLGSVGYTAVGTLFAGISANAKMREVMLPLLLFPVEVPILLGAMRTTGEAFARGSLSAVRGWVNLMGAFDILFVVAGLLLFEYVLEE